MTYTHRHREIIELSATVAAANTETRTSARIPYPFKLKELQINSTATLQTDFTLRIGTTKGGTEAIANDPLFTPLISNKSSKENQRYPSQSIQLKPELIFPQPEHRFKVEATNNAGITHDYHLTLIIEEWRPGDER